MPTTLTYIIDPDNGPGADYTSLAAAEAALQANFVTADVIKVLECRSSGGTADTTAATFTGSTTDATRYWQIQSSGANRHAGIWDASKYRLSTAAATALNLSQAYTRVVGLQIITITSAHCVSLGAEGCRVEKSILQINSGANDRAVATAAAVSVYCYNNLILVSTSRGISCTTASATLYDENNTIISVSGGTGLQISNGTHIARNNIVSGFGNTNSYVGTFAAGTDNNTTDGTDAIGTGSNNSTSQTFTFTNSAGGDYSLASGDTGARDKGTLLSAISSGFTDDIKGNPRDASGAIDCGCFEFQSATNPIRLIGPGGLIGPSLLVGRSPLIG
jgi:hypothetical protein